MSDSHDLPGEIILEIARFATPVDPSGIGYPIGPEELRNLRLVSKRFNNLISPLLFSILHLHFGDVDNRKSPMPDFIRCQEIITALATRSTSVFHHTKKLRLYIGIRYRVESEGILSVWTLLTDNIFDAICGLKNLRTIHCFFDTTPSTEVSVKIIYALGTLSSFKGFEHIGFSTPFHFPLSFTFKPLSNLTIFRIERDRDSTWHFIPEVASLLSRCPDMTELSLSGRYSLRHEKPILRLREIFSEIGQLEKPWRLQKLELKSVEVTPDDIRAHIRHLKHLTFLELLENPCSGSATTFGEIWDIFKQHGIALKELSTDHLEDPFYLHYLSSCSGLTSLQLKVSPEGYENPEAVKQIYLQVLPKHAETLECLELEWCGTPTKEGLAELVKCQKLTVLEVYTDVSEETLKEGDVSHFEMWLDAGLQLPNLKNISLRPSVMHYSEDYSTFDDTLEAVVLKYRAEKGLSFAVNYYLPEDDD